MLYKNGTEPWKGCFYITLISILSICVQTFAADANSNDEDDLGDDDDD